METDSTLIAIPTYQERDNVGPIVAALFQMVPAADVILIDDNSPDGTVAEAERRFGTDPRFSVLPRSGPRSYGRSLFDGYRIAVDRDYNRLVQMDADFSHDPAMVPALISATDKADVSIGSRYCVGGSVANWPLRRRLLSRFANIYVRASTGLPVHDSTSGFRCYTRRALECLLRIGLNSDGYAFQVEALFLAQREGLRVVEIPITFTDRRDGRSKMSGKIIVESSLRPWSLRFGR